MPKPYSNMLAVFLILFAFAEQSMAYAVSTHFDYSPSTLTQDKSLVAEQHANDDCCDVECCEGNCICPANTCMPALYLPVAVSSSQIIVQHHLSLKLSTKQPISISALVYRPPILIS